MMGCQGHLLGRRVWRPVGLAANPGDGPSVSRYDEELAQGDGADRELKVGRASRWGPKGAD